MGRGTYFSFRDYISRRLSDSFDCRVQLLCVEVATRVHVRKIKEIDACSNAQTRYTAVHDFDSCTSSNAVEKNAAIPEHSFFHQRLASTMQSGDCSSKSLRACMSTVFHRNGYIKVHRRSAWYGFTHRRKHVANPDTAVGASAAFSHVRVDAARRQCGKRGECRYRRIFEKIDKCRIER